MTLSMWMVFGVTLMAIVLFITEWIRFDIVGLMVLLSLALVGIITHDQALQGFSNPAVVTIASVLVLSGGLSRTGVANVVGRHVLVLAGKSQARLILLMMATAGLLSGIMNNIAVTALLLPVVIDIARKTGQAPSKLLIPLAFGSLLGGQMTLIGTAPNILIAGFVENSGLTPFQMFDFTPVGSVVLAGGILYMVLIGRRLLPSRESGVAAQGRSIDIHAVYDLQNTVITVTIPRRSPLAGLSLAESRLGVALGLNVLAIRRNGERQLAPTPGFILRGGDQLFMQGRIEPLESLQSWKPLLQPDQRLPMTDDLVSESVGLAEVSVVEGSSACGCTLSEIDLRTLFGVTVIAIARGEKLKRSRLQEIELEADDVLLVIGQVDRIQALAAEEDFADYGSLGSRDADSKYQLEERLMNLIVPEESPLAGNTLKESRLGDALGVSVLEVRRKDESVRLPYPDMVLEVGDELLIAGREKDLRLLDAFQDLEVHRDPPDIEGLESDDIGFAEATLAPRTSLMGKTLPDLFFREKYGLTVCSIWRGDRSYHSNVTVRSMPLRLGDALLVYGARDKLAKLAHDPDFLVLTEEAREVYRTSKVAVAAAIMGAVILSVAFKLLPIQIAAPSGAVLMVLSGCLTPEEAYSFIEWKVLILIAGMLGLGLAMQESGAANLIASNVVGSVGQFGPLAVVAGLFLITALSAQIMPTAAVAVLMSPIALSSAADLGLSPQALMMTVAVASSCAFLSPVGHPANLLVMGLGGYRFTDYTKVGVGLFLTVMAVVMLVLPLVWPLTG
jgi:di/tricarboxylate transporter